MSRYIHQGHFKDQSGNIVPSGRITIYEADTNTLANVYEAVSGGTAVNYVTSDSYGYFKFYVDTGDYNANQKFDIVLTKSGFSSQTYEDIIIYPDGSNSSTGIFAFHGRTGSTILGSTGTTAGGSSGTGGAAQLRFESGFTGNYGNTSYTIGDIVKALKKKGFIST